ncbi:ATP-binding protein [Streptomyces sp. NPDC046887]|uniref:ATP-binding protein n=1 Tax=Streptomyces sp. NPDC046887 TaxID=3155472 RepID=UPI0034065540
MSVPAPPVEHRSAKARGTSRAAPVAVLAVSAAAAGAAVVLAPSGARTWTQLVAAAAWVCLAAAVLVGGRAVRRARRAAAARAAEAERHRAALAQLSSETAYLVNVTLPGLAQRRDGTAAAAEPFGGVLPPSDPQLARVLHLFTSAIEAGERQAAALDAERRQARQELDEAAAELERLARETLPAAVARLREGRSADTVRAELTLPRMPLVRVPTETFIRELALSERRAAAAQAASAKALSRVQAKSVSMLADLREMQDRHGEEVFGDLLRLDHSTSQLGLMTDRLALLMGGRSSRSWNKPIVMESILRGAVGRIAAYQRVRLHCATSVAISGFAAEGVMHLLAELMDNAANFSPPIDEVHVYVEERSAGIVVTIEDSGLKMADAAMRRAADAVAGRMNDLVSLQGTRLGLAVVGRLAVKHGISVNYRPSSRGGTGVVVLLPRQLLAQQQRRAPRLLSRETATGTAPAQTAAPAPTAAPYEPAPAPVPIPTPTPAPEPAAVHFTDPAAVYFTDPGEAAAVAERPAVRPGASEQAAHRRPAASTPNGLPVRTPGRTMGEAERERGRGRERSAPPAPTANGTGTGTGTEPGTWGGEVPEQRPGRDAGSRFGAFARARRSPRGTTGGGARPEPPAGGPSSS